MAEEDSQLCLQSVQFMTHNMLATSLPRSNIFSWTSKTSRRESFKAFWIIHGSVVKSPVKQQDGFKGQGDVRTGQLSFSSCFCSCPQRYGWGIAFSQGGAGDPIPFVIVVWIPHYHSKVPAKSPSSHEALFLPPGLSYLSVTYTMPTLFLCRGYGYTHML